MPWRGPAVPGDFPTLGFQVAEWIEHWCVIPDGDRMGQPFILTNEMIRFLQHYYRIDPQRGRFKDARGGQLVRPQKWGKGPFTSAVTLAEGSDDAPVLFDGWDANGEPVGRPWATPWIQITATTEDQTANVYRALVPMIELGPLGNVIPDTGLTRINLPGGGLIEPVTSAATSRLGQRITFALQDETHSWTERNAGRKLASTQRRNLAGMGGRFLETTNGWDPADASVAQQTNENPIGTYVDFAQGPKGSVTNKAERRRVLRVVYGDSAIRRGAEPQGWIDLDRIDEEIEALLPIDPAQAERFFMNRIVAGAGTAYDAEEWNELADATHVVPDKALVVLGVDGARFDDALAVVATEVTTGYQWNVITLERPENAPEDYEHDFEMVHDAVAAVFDAYSVWRAYVDPQRIERLVERWQGKWTDRVVVEWHTNRPRQMCEAVRKHRVAVRVGELSHDGDGVFARHVRNARRRAQPTIKDDEGMPMYDLQKDRRGSSLKIDAAMAAILSWEARGDAIAANAQPPRRRRAAGF
jgi:hypothetical protein